MEKITHNGVTGFFFTEQEYEALTDSYKNIQTLIKTMGVTE